MVPNGGEFSKLGNVAELQRGFDLPSTKRIDGNIPIVSSSGVSGYHNEYKVEKPGIVTGRYGSIGNVYYVEENFWPLNTSLWVKNFHSNYPKFIYYLLSSFDFKKFSDKTGVPGVNRNDLHAVKVAVPPLLEQKKIVKILSTWDEAISTTERLIENSTQQKKALMQQLLTGKKRLLDESGQRFEGEWEDTKLKNIIHLLSGHAFKSSEFEKHTGFKLLRGMNISRGFLRWGSEQTFTWSDAEKYERYLLKINDIVVSMDGSLVGRNYALIQQKNFEPMLLVQRVARIRCKDTLSPTYLLQHISSKRFESYVDSVKTVTAIPHISAKDIREFRVPLASIEEQQKIATVLTNADKEIELLEQQLADLQQEKKALMQVLLTGKKRVVVDGDVK